ncbi:VCBS repeat-containing protein, partial [bacterium]|nr:VCBS repeat-containing protein [bacterium]
MSERLNRRESEHRAFLSYVILILPLVAFLQTAVPGKDAGFDLPFPRPGYSNAPSKTFPRVYQEPSAIADAGQVPQDVVASDFNGDGHADLAVAYAYDDRIGWFLGDGTGGFTPKGQISVGVQAGDGNDLPRSLVAADFDRDGFQDLAVLCSGNPNPPFSTPPSLGILYGLPGGLFETYREVIVVPEGQEPPLFSVALAAGQLDADDFCDLIVGHFDSNQLSLIHGKTGRRWEEPRLTDVVTSGAGPSAVAIADLDFDGADDLIVLSRRDVQVWRNNGSGQFPFRSILGYGSAFSALALADFDRDGLWDLVVLDAGRNEMRLFFDVGAHGAPVTQSLFTLTEPPPSGEGPIDILVYDENLDGRDDIALVYLLSGGGDIYLGRPNGVQMPLAWSRHFETAKAPRAIASSDFDHDGWPDLIVAHEGDKDISDNADLVLTPGIPPPTPPALLDPLTSSTPGENIAPYL